MEIRYEKQGNVAIFTLDNGPVNALTPPMHKQMYDHLKEFTADPDIHAGVLTGAGDRYFCGGDDIKNSWRKGGIRTKTLEAHFYPSDPNAEPNSRPGWEREVRALQRFKPIVGALNGPALGMGFIYAMDFMDIRVATPDAYLAIPEIAYGMGGASGWTQLGRYMPPAVALKFALLAEKLSPQDAVKYGLFNEIVEPDQLMDRAMEYAEKIASFPPIAVQVEMEGFYRSMELSRSDTNAFMAHLYRLQRATIGYDGEIEKSVEIYRASTPKSTA
jgi:enoyl-CoA hydratase/carnithine racemase